MNIDEYISKMTIFYSRLSGSIKGVATGVQDMSFYGDNELDFEIIYDFIVVDNDDYVLQNIDQFKVVDEQIKLKNPVNLNKYL